MKKIIKHFCVDIEAAKTALLLGINRNTINHWYLIFRIAIYDHVEVGYNKHFRVHHGSNEFSKGDGIDINGIENFWSFTKRRLAKFNGVKKNFELHLKECEWRYGRKSDTLEKELWQILKKYYKQPNI